MRALVAVKGISEVKAQKILAEAAKVVDMGFQTVRSHAFRRTRNRLRCTEGGWLSGRDSLLASVNAL